MLLMPVFNLQAQEVKAISFNIRNSDAAREDGIYAWPYRTKAVVAMIRKERPDVMGLQEALLDQLSKIDREFMRQYRRVGIGRDNGLTRGEHMAIYYNTDKVELVSARTRWLSTSPRRVSIGWDAACLRTVTIAKFRMKDSGKQFYYFNTHLDHVGSTARSKSIELITKLIIHYSQDGTPVILGGDMNVDLTSPIFEPLYQIGMITARKTASKSDDKISYNAFGKEPGKQIDQFFVRGVKTKRFRTLDRDYGIKYISDHYPIEIVFDL